MPGLSERSKSTLASAIDAAHRKMAPFRANRLLLLKNYLGPNYGSGNGMKKLPINMVRQGVNVYVRSLIAQNPGVMVNTVHPPLKDQAWRLEQGLKHLVRGINLKEGLRGTIFDAMFGMGIMKVGLVTDTKVDVDGAQYEVGQPFASPVLFDNFAIDPDADDVGHALFMGDYFEMPEDVAKASGLYDMKYVETADGEPYHGAGDKITRSLGGEPDSTSDRYRKRARFFQCWLPYEDKVRTFAVGNDGKCGKQVRDDIEWDGPRLGPYRLLRFFPTPGNILPAAPVQDWIDLHDAINAIHRKMIRQALRQKSVTGIRVGAEHDGHALKNASDGDMISMLDPKSAVQVAIGGVDQTNFGYAVHARNAEAMAMGNLDLIAGLSPSSDTARQDALLSESASKLLSELQDSVMDFTRDVVQDLAFYLWSDPLIEIPMTRRVPGVNVEVPVTYRSRDNVGDFLDFNFEIVPYSMAHQTPTQRGAFLANLDRKPCRPHQ